MTRMALLQDQKFGALRRLYLSSRALESPQSPVHRVPLAQDMQAVEKQKDIQKHYWILIGILIIISSSSGNAFPSLIKFHSAIWTSLNLGFEIFFPRAFGHPQFTFRTFRVISRTDEIWIACVMGDLEQMERLLANGQASPYDTTEDGATLLHVCRYIACIIV